MASSRDGIWHLAMFLRGNYKVSINSIILHLQPMLKILYYISTKHNLNYNHYVKPWITSIFYKNNDGINLIFNMMTTSNNINDNLIDFLQIPFVKTGKVVQSRLYL